MTETKRVYIQCNPLLDISAVVTAEFLGKYNVIPGSASLVSEEQLTIYEEMENMEGVTYVPGGSGLNTARVAQWVAQVPKDSFVSYVGCIADDKYGSILTEAAAKEGVTMVLEHTTKAPTGTCAACILGKERALVANLAAANCLSPEHMQTADVLAALKRSKLFYLTGFTLTIDVAYVQQVAEAAREVGGAFLLNLSAPFIVEFFGDQLKAVLPYVDVLFGNESEARALAKALSWDTDSVDEIARMAATQLPYTGSGDRLVVFTQGADHTAYAFKSGTTGTVPVACIAPESIVDTNGAGDAFVGGFLAAYADGKPVTRCCEVGHYAAGVIIQHDGCTFPTKPSITL